MLIICVTWSQSHLQQNEHAYLLIHSCTRGICTHHTITQQMSNFASFSTPCLCFVRSNKRIMAFMNSLCTRSMSSLVMSANGFLSTRTGAPICDRERVCAWVREWVWPSKNKVKHTNKHTVPQYPSAEVGALKYSTFRTPQGFQCVMYVATIAESPSKSLNTRTTRSRQMHTSERDRYRIAVQAWRIPYEYEGRSCAGWAWSWAALSPRHCIDRHTHT
jgi:hypothetical protein